MFIDSLSDELIPQENVSFAFGVGCTGPAPLFTGFVMFEESETIQIKVLFTRS